MRSLGWLAAEATFASGSRTEQTINAASSMESIRFFIVFYLRKPFVRNHSYQSIQIHTILYSIFAVFARIFVQINRQLRKNRASGRFARNLFGCSVQAERGRHGKQ
jgi:hypothetical protein